MRNIAGMGVNADQGRLGISLGAVGDEPQAEFFASFAPRCAGALARKLWDPDRRPSRRKRCGDLPRLRGGFLPGLPLAWRSLNTTIRRGERNRSFDRDTAGRCGVCRAGGFC